MSNLATMGISEGECIGQITASLQHIIGLERTARKRILTDAKLELSDRVYRAIGILTHARTLGVDEFLNCASAVRLGILCNIYDGTTVSKLNQLMLMIMPAHLCLVYGKELKESEERVARAETVRNFFGIKRRSVLKKRTTNG
jgi:protein arginine kinase